MKSRKFLKLAAEAVAKEEQAVKRSVLETLDKVAADKRFRGLIKSYELSHLYLTEDGAKWAVGFDMVLDRKAPAGRLAALLCTLQAYFKYENVESIYTHDFPMIGMSLRLMPAPELDEAEAA
jgi:hypothetical protein